MIPADLLTKISLAAVLVVSLTFSTSFTVWYTDNHAPYVRAESSITQALVNLTEKTRLQTAAIQALTDTVHSQNLRLERLDVRLEIQNQPSPSSP